MKSEPWGGPDSRMGWDPGGQPVGREEQRLRTGPGEVPRLRPCAHLETLKAPDAVSSTPDILSALAWEATWILAFFVCVFSFGECFFNLKYQNLKISPGNNTVLLQ